MTSLDLRPLAIGELLDRSFTLFKRHLLLFVGIMAVPSVFGLVVALALSVYQGVQGPLVDGTEPPDLQKMAGVLAIILGGMFIFLIVNWIIYMLALGATTIAVSELYVGRTATIRSSYSRVVGMLGPLMLLGALGAARIGGLWMVIVLSAVVVSIALVPLLPILAPLVVFFALVVGTIWCGYLALRYAVSVPALVLEQASAMTAIRRSIFLTRGHLGAVILLVLCAMAITYASLAVFQAPFVAASVMAGPESTLGFSLNLVGTVTGSLASTLTAPIMVIGFAVLYYDLRIRKEALDLQMMMLTLDAAPGAAPAPSPTPALPVLPD